jgi:hypothetical protein
MLGRLAKIDSISSIVMRLGRVAFGRDQWQIARVGRQVFGGNASCQERNTTTT